MFNLNQAQSAPSSKQVYKMSPKLKLFHEVQAKYVFLLTRTPKSQDLSPGSQSFLS